MIKLKRIKIASNQLTLMLILLLSLVSLTGCNRLTNEIKMNGTAEIPKKMQFGTNFLKNKLNTHIGAIKNSIYMGVLYFAIKIISTQ